MLIEKRSRILNEFGLVESPSKLMTTKLTSLESAREHSGRQNSTNSPNPFNSSQRQASYIPRKSRIIQEQKILIGRKKRQTFGFGHGFPFPTQKEDEKVVLELQSAFQSSTKHKFNQKSIGSMEEQDYDLGKDTNSVLETIEKKASSSRMKSFSRNLMNSTYQGSFKVAPSHMERMNQTTMGFSSFHNRR